MSSPRRHLPGVALGAFAALAGSLASGTASAQDMPCGPKPDKPYDGAEVTVMLPDAGQYRAQSKRLGELEELTGIKANFSYVPYGQLLDKITAEAMAGSDTYDLVTWQDTWGPSLSGFLEPLDDRVEEDGIDLSTYPRVFVDSATYKDTIEAARVDGAGEGRIFFGIMLPQLRSVLTVTILLKSIFSVKMLEQVITMTKGGPGTSTATVPYTVYETAFRWYDFGYAAAMAYFLAFVMMVLAMVYARLTMERL